MSKGNKRFTVFDMMAERGDFENNPANAVSGANYKAAPYPKMFYHPKGEMRVTRRPDVVEGPAGVQFLNEQKELIWKVANTPGEEQTLREQGWHDHPAKSMRAGGADVVVPESMPSLQAQLAAANAELERLRGKGKPGGAPHV